MPPELDAAAVRDHVRRIAASPGFANAERLRRFLEFTVEAHLSEERGRIKEYTLGREVFDRNGEYDPRTDPIVRVEARRLRARLDEYYAGPGSTDPIRIEFPKGGYAPLIRLLNPDEPAAVDPPAPHEPSRDRRLIAGIFVAFVTVALIIWLVRPAKAPGLTLVAVPARWIFTSTANLDPVDEPLTEKVIATLAARGRVPVIGWPPLLESRGAAAGSRQLAARFDAGFLLAIAVRRESETQSPRATVYLTESATGRKLWAEDFTGAYSTPAGRAAVAISIADGVESAVDRWKRIRKP